MKNLIKFCEGYDAFSIPAAIMVRGSAIKLQDVYTHLDIVPLSDYLRDKKKLPDSLTYIQNILKYFRQVLKTKSDSNIFQTVINIHPKTTQK